MYLKKRTHAQLLLFLCALNLLNTGIVLAFSDEASTEDYITRPLKPGVSEVLDSPEPLAFRQVAQFITENYGVVKHDGFDKMQTANPEKDVPVWHIKERLKRNAQETELLAEKYAHTPEAEQYAIASKLTEYEKGFDPLSPQKPPKTIVSVDLLRELQFLNGDHHSILKAISRLTTKGGEIAMTALVAKCNDNLAVIKERQNFIKVLIENPVLLNKLQDQLDSIKTTEPLLFSNYRPFKQDRLSAFVKGGMIKTILKQLWPNSYRAERMATNTELVYKPMASLTISAIFSGLSLFDLVYTWWTFNKKNNLSNIGATIKNAVDFGGGWPVIRLPHRIIHSFIDSWSWDDFLEQQVLTGSLKAPSASAKETYTKEQQKEWFFKRTSFLKKLRADFDAFYTSKETHYNSSNFFETHDKKKDITSFEIKKLADAYLKKEGWGKLETRKDHAATTIQRVFRRKKVRTFKESNRPKSPKAPKAEELQAMNSRGDARAARMKEKAELPFDKKHPNAASFRKNTSIKLVQKLHGIKHEHRVYNTLAIFAVLGVLVVMIPQMEMAYKTYMNSYLDLKNLFNSVQAPYRAYKAAQQIHKLLAGNDSTAHLYPQFIPSTSKQWLSFLELVQSETFETSFGPAGMAFKDHGKVVQAYHLLMQSQEEIGELIRFYGELDAYVSMARLVQEFGDTHNNEGTPTRYSFVHFEEKSSHPRFDAKHYWNPMFSAKRAVPNHMNIGEDGKTRGVIVTGANAGGKSGNIKAILTNIILAQTFGIAPAENLNMTVFSFIQATLKSNDDTAGGKSRFQVEALDMARVMQRVITLPKDKFCAIFSDELFAGTEVEPAVALTRRICLSIAGMDNVIYILATHYKDLTKLELMTDGIFKNFKVEVIKLPDGSLHRPYRLIEGIGGTNIAFDVFIEQLGELGMKDGYLHEMVRQAKSDQTMHELLNPHKTLGVEASFSNRNGVQV